LHSMRIAQVAPLAESVPPKLYGGTERVVSWLTEELIELGHDVTLFASGDSVTRAELVPVIPRALRLSRPHGDPASACAILIDKLAHRASGFDVIHCHTDWLHLPVLRRLGVPFLTTLHGRLDLPPLAAAAQYFGDTALVSISNQQRAPVPDLRWINTVYHGLPLEALKPNYSDGDYLAFLGRLSPEKGPHLAIKWARSAGLPLRIAAKIPSGENRFVKKQIEPFLDGQMVQFVGEVNDRRKTDFLGHAKALLFPIDWPEPFGLVMVEAMACGTPVIAFSRGSVPEIIENGVTGFIVENEAQAIEAIECIGTLDRQLIRAEFERRFSVERMAQNYVRCYEHVAGKEFGSSKENARALDGGDSASPGDVQIHPLSSLGFMSRPTR
jgi:glycosyltransferase involved in cell wall biosynthesis